MCAKNQSIIERWSTCGGHVGKNHPITERWSTCRHQVGDMWAKTTVGGRCVGDMQAKREVGIVQVTCGHFLLKIQRGGRHVGNMQAFVGGQICCVGDMWATCRRFCHFAYTFDNITSRRVRSQLYNLWKRMHSLWGIISVIKFVSIFDGSSVN